MCQVVQSMHKVRERVIKIDEDVCINAACMSKCPFRAIEKK